MDIHSSVKVTGRNHKYSVATDGQQQKQATSCLVRSVLCLHRPQVKFQKALEKFGFLIARYPKSVIFFSLICMILCSVGFVRLRSASSLSDDAFYPSTSLSKQHLKYMSEFGPNGIREEKILLIPSAGSNIFNSECLREALAIHDTITNITGYQNVCFRDKSDGPCMIINVFEAIGFDPEMLQNFSTILSRELTTNDPMLLTNGRTISFLKYEIFSHLKLQEDGNTYSLSAKAMKMVYFLKQPQNDSFEAIVNIWEKNFISQMNSLKDKLKCSRVLYVSEADKKEAFSELFLPHFKSLLISISIIFFAILTSILAMVSKGAVLLAAAGSLFMGTYIVLSVAISFAAGASFTNATIVVLVFIGARGIGDVLLIIFEMEYLTSIPSVKHRIAGCATDAGLTVTTIALFDAAVFGLTQLTTFKVIKDAFLVALLAIPLRYFFLFPCLLGSFSVWLQNHQSCFKHTNLLSCFGRKRDTNHQDADTQESKRKVTTFEKYGHFLTKKVSKIVVVILTLGIIAGCVYVHLNHGLDYQDNTALMPRTSRVASFKTTEMQYFQDIDVNILLMDPSIGYETPAVQGNIRNIAKTLHLDRYSARNMTSWLAKMLSWSQANRVGCQMDEFIPCFRKFLAVPQNALYKKDIVFSNATKVNIKYSRLHLFMSLKGTILDKIQQLRSLRKDLAAFSTKTNLQFVPANHRFLLLDMLAIFKSEGFNILIVIGLAILLCPLPLTVSVRIGILLLMSFILHVEELIVLAQIWHLPLNPVSFYCLLIGLMLALHVNIQMLQVRSLATDDTVEMRTVTALESAGPSIFFTLVVCTMCSISLSFIFPFLSTIFLCILPLLFVLAAFHSLVLLPVIILISSKPAEKLMKRIAIEDAYDINVLSDHYELEQRAEAFEDKHQQPTSCIVGVGCRFPQASDKENFFEMLSSGRCAVSQFPSNRPEEYEIFQEAYHPKRFVKSRICTVGGAFLENIRGFDAEFFNISAQEAPSMDPQQRILLQVVYEAIEDAGLRLEDLQKCKTGVFAGVMNLDYGRRILKPDNLLNMDQFYSTGSTSSIVANRISFCLNLTGPSLSVDTACSSSLTALNIAQCCLTSGQCDVAIVCAPNIILDAVTEMTFSIGGFLAPDGRCKCFDASADGYGRGEGFAAIVLKPTAVSLADNDDIYCEIVACGMNNDGQDANPITAPSPKTQTELSKAVLIESGLSASNIDYVEAHGTGTAIGDVVETTSIANTYCDNSAAKHRILRIGSVKSNINHTESTSGLAGLIKVAFMIKNKMFFPTANIGNMNPKLKLTEKGIVVQESCERWIKDDDSCRIAAINSFGYGGSNVHAILREVHLRSTGSSRKYELPKAKFILPLSAKSHEALRILAEKFGSWIRDQPDNLNFKLGLCYSLTERRSHYKCRLSLVFQTVEEASVLLGNFASRQSNEEYVSKDGSTKQSILFVFGGQGANWEGMGKEMMDCEPLFREHVCEVERLLKDLGESWSLIDEISSSGKKGIMGNIIGQPACFAIQYATYKLLESWGIYPSAVVGHSLGELTAACCSGALSVREALQIILIRSKCHEKCSKEGSMAALGMQEDEAKKIIIDLKLDNVVCIAAVNDQSNVTVSGNKDAIECIGNHLKLQHPDVFWKILPTARAFHSTYIEAVKAPFCAEMKSTKLNPKPMRIPMYSTVFGDKIFPNQLDQSYWWRNMRQCVSFYPAVTQALNDGRNITIEISPQPVLKHYLHNIATQVKSYTNNSVSNLLTFPPKRQQEQHKAFLENTLCELYNMGYPIYWSALYGTGNFVRFPTYPWKETEFWYRDKSPAKTVRSLQPSTATVRESHPFLREVKLTEQYSGIMCWETEIDLYRFPTFKDHVLTQIGPVLPGSACVEMALAMAAERFQRPLSTTIRDVTFTNLLTLPESQLRLLRLRLEMSTNNTEGTFSVCNVIEEGTEMPLAKGSIFAESSSSLTTGMDFSQPKENPGIFSDALKQTISCMTEVPLSTFQNLTKKLGFDFGPCYCLVKKIWRKQNSALCQLEMDGPFVKEIPLYVIHPAFVDACFQTSVACEDDDGSQTSPTTVPIGVKSFVVFDRNIPKITYCHVSKTTFEGKFTYDMRLVDSFGKEYLIIEQFRSTEISNLIQLPKLDEVAYQINWVESRLDGKAIDHSDSVIVVMSESKGFGLSFVDILLQNCPAKIQDVKLSENLASEDLINRLKTALSDGSYSKIMVINFWPVETSFHLPTNDGVDHLQEFNCMRLVDILKFLEELQSSSTIVCKLVAVSRCTQFVTGIEEDKIPWASTVWGFCRTARLESQNIRTINVDLCRGDSLELDQLAREIMVESLHDEVVLREDKRYISRLVRSAPGSLPIAVEELKHQESLSSPLYLTAHPNNGQICLRKLTENSYFSQENIEVSVSNFWVPNDIRVQLRGSITFMVAYSGSITSSESDGEVPLTTEVVCGMTRTNRLGNILHIKKDEVIKKPEELSLSQAASLSGCLPLAYYAIQQAITASSDTCKDMVIIIHEINKDLGLAGMLVANALGYSVIGTTSDSHFEDSKRFLKEQGAWMVTDAHLSDLTSHNLSQSAEASIFFYETPPNSMRRSCQFLKKGGKVILLGEMNNCHVVFPSNKSISCQYIEYNDILDIPGKYRALWSSCWQLLTSTDTLKILLKVNQHEINIVEVFNDASELLMEKMTAQIKTDVSFSSYSFNADKKTGSVVQVLPVGMDQYKLKQDRTYMVVGGVRGFGFEVAKWMAYNGAGTLVLLARSKPSTLKLQEVSLLEKETGTTIKIFQGDVSNHVQMKEMSSKELSKLPSMAGIFLTAMVLRDQLIPKIDREAFHQVMAPKVQGAYILHEMSLNMNLDFFVMFSSIASLLGNPGQASYSAANSFLDSLACYRRRALGLPAISINWGPIKGAGVLQRQENVAALLSRAGYRMLEAKQAIEFMEQILIKEPLTARIGLFSADWSRIFESSAGLSKSTRLEAIKQEIQSLQTERDWSSLGPKIWMERDHTKQRSMVEEVVRDMISSWSGVPTNEIDFNGSLYAHGLDSFFALTFKMQLETTLEVSFEVFYFMQPQTTPSKIVYDIVNKLKSKQQTNQAINQSKAERTPGDAVQESKSKREEPDPGIREYPKDSSRPNATYQVTPLCVPDGAELMFFCVHPAGRYVMNLLPISETFKAQSLVSFYAIGHTDPTMTGDSRSVQQLAQSYVNMIKQLQRHGPYFLGGQSFGGMIAFEMASLLVEEGEDVAFVAMIDTFPWEISNRSAAARLEILFGGTKLEHLMEGLFQATFEQILSKLATQTLKMAPDEYDATRKTLTQDGIMDFLQERAQHLHVPLYDIKSVRKSLEHDSKLAAHEHRKWRPGSIYYQGPLTFLKSADQRFTPLKPLQESSDDAWSMLVDGDIDVYVCPGDHLALSEPAYAFIIGGILATGIGMAYRRRFGLLKNVPRTYMEKKSIQKFVLGVDVLLYSRKGSKPPKYGKLYLEEDKNRLVFKAREFSGKPKQGSQRRNVKVINLTGLSNVLPGRLVAKAIKMVKGFQNGGRGNIKQTIAMVMSDHRVYTFEPLSMSDLKSMYQMMESVFSVAMANKLEMM